MPGYLAPTPETSLVFAVANPAVDQSLLTRLLPECRDWVRALTLGTMEAALPAMRRALKPHADSLPADIPEFLRLRTMIIEFQMAQLSTRVQQTVSVFAERGIPVMLLKGAAIGALTDSTFSGRPMTDVDLLIHAADVDRATQAVLDTGWSLKPDPILAELLEGQHHLPPFVRADLPGLRLELHTMLLPPDDPFVFPLERLWETAVPAPKPFVGAVVPDPAHLMVHTCIHYAWQHQLHFGSWRTFRSVATIAQLPGFSWDGLEQLARKSRAVSCVFWTLHLARGIAAVPIPEATLKRLAPPNPQWLTRALARHFVANLALGEGEQSPSIWLSRKLWTLALRPKWSGLGPLGRHDPEHRWDRAYGRVNTETRLERLARHVGEMHRWWNFFSRTLLGR